MRLKNNIRIIATTAAVAAAIAPAAQAQDIGQGGGDPTVPTQHVIAAPSHPGSTDWALIALAGGGTGVLIGAGVGGSRRVTRRRDSATRADVA
ncbi:MAG TPA: hypothetical protein VMA96_14195 [Solirubrobacteraceae bacterium]|nr:hypothetical protein [Solirubrobacteraceae bacterium]